MVTASELMNDFNVMNMESHILALAAQGIKKAQKNINHISELSDSKEAKNNAISLLNNI